MNIFWSKSSKGVAKRVHYSEVFLYVGSVTTPRWKTTMVNRGLRKHFFFVVLYILLLSRWVFYKQLGYVNELTGVFVAFFTFHKIKRSDFFWALTFVCREFISLMGETRQTDCLSTDFCCRLLLLALSYCGEVECRVCTFFTISQSIYFTNRLHVAVRQFSNRMT